MCISLNRTENTSGSGISRVLKEVPYAKGNPTCVFSFNKNDGNVQTVVTAKEETVAALKQHLHSNASWWTEQRLASCSDGVKI